MFSTYHTVSLNIMYEYEDTLTVTCMLSGRDVAEIYEDGIYGKSEDSFDAENNIVCCSCKEILFTPEQKTFIKHLISLSGLESVYKYLTQNEEN